MWYRANIAEAPNDDTEDQLAEWTIRDHLYLVNPKITTKTNSEIPDNQLVTLINYDVSNVDNLYLPLAMEANDVWVVPQKTGEGPNAEPEWLGPRVGSRYLRLDRRHQHDQLLADHAPGIHRRTTTSSSGEYFGSKKQAGPFITSPTPPTTRTRPSRSRPAPTSLRKARSRTVPSSYGNATMAE